MKFDIIIIGAGASGLAAAYQAASSSKLNILVIEKEAAPGRKLSAAGNGKCNLTNKEFKEGCYHSRDAEFIRNWVARNSYQDIIDFFEKMGVLLYQNNGYYYPISNQGKQVTGMLYQRSMDLGVRYAFHTRVTAIHIRESGRKSFYFVDTINDKGKQQTIQSKYLVLATGGAASPKLGGCKDGYSFAQTLGIRQNPIFPVLSPVYVEDTLLSIAKGVRIDGTVTLRGEDDFCVRESGQIQINEKSLSGIAIMNLSCYLNKWGRKRMADCLSMDVLPQFTWDSLKKFFLEQKCSYPEETLKQMLDGLLPGPFTGYLLKRLRMEGSMQVKNLTEKQINRFTSSLKKLVFTPVYCEDYEKAQATGGGIAMEEICPDTFECIKYPNLYITGELLDVNGICGGYNLTFAILSGIQAANNVIKDVEI